MPAASRMPWRSLWRWSLRWQLPDKSSASPPAPMPYRNHENRVLLSKCSSTSRGRNHAQTTDIHPGLREKVAPTQPPGKESGESGKENLLGRNTILTCRASNKHSGRHVDANATYSSSTVAFISYRTTSFQHYTMRYMAHGSGTKPYTIEYKIKSQNISYNKLRI